MSRALVLACVLCPAVASADTFKLFGEIHGGGMYGQGLSGTQKDTDFFQKTEAPQRSGQGCARRWHFRC